MDYNFLLEKNVSILLDNNIIIEGIIKKWDDHVELLSKNNITTLIMKPNEDIKIIKILNKKENIVTEKNDYSMESLEIKGKNLLELKKELIKEEKDEILNKLKDHEIKNTTQVKYSSPTFFYKSKKS